MEEIKTEPIDFVKEFQEYLTQQTQHVNMISGSVCGEKEAAEHYPSHIHVSQAVEQGGVDPQPPEVSLSVGDVPDVHVDGLERTSDGKYKCSYCSYANKGLTRLIEHIRIHTGEKPHRCQLCPFASAYERHLEAHMRSHTGEKPYKCDLCSFRCSDRSNLSHHRRRRHKLLPARLQPFANKRMLSALQKRTNSIGYGRRLLLNFNPASVVTQKADYVNDFPHKHHEFRKLDESHVSSNLPFSNPLNQLSTLAGQLSEFAPDCSESPKDEKPILIQHITSEAVSTHVSSGVQTSPAKPQSPVSQNCSPTPGISFENMANSDSNSQPNSPGRVTVEVLQKCPHCDIHFSDNILFTIHMGCHGFEQPFQCNICGHICNDKYDFACHFARGQHK